MNTNLKQRIAHPSIGPHEGQEYDLMCQGRKPLAIMNSLKQFEDKIAQGEFVALKCEFPMRYTLDGVVGWYKEPYVDYFVALKDEAWRIDVLKAIYDAHHTDGTPLDHVVIGYLLGYEKHHVEAFLGCDLDEEGWDNVIPRLKAHAA